MAWGLPGFQESIGELVQLAIAGHLAVSANAATRDDVITLPNSYRSSPSKIILNATRGAVATLRSGSDLQARGNTSLKSRAVRRCIPQQREAPRAPRANGVQKGFGTRLYTQERPLHCLWIMVASAIVYWSPFPQPTKQEGETTKRDEGWPNNYNAKPVISLTYG